MYLRINLSHFTAHCELSGEEKEGSEAALITLIVASGMKWSFLGVIDQVVVKTEHTLDSFGGQDWVEIATASWRTLSSVWQKLLTPGSINSNTAFKIEASGKQPWSSGIALAELWLYFLPVTGGLWVSSVCWVETVYAWWFSQTDEYTPISKHAI